MTGPAYHGRTHLPGGTDPIPGLLPTSGPGLEDLILGNSPVGLWKLNDTSGSTAADSSGNANHMTVPSGYITATWGQTAGPPGTPAALFIAEPAGSDAGTRFNLTMSSPPTDNLSAGVWVKAPNITGQLNVIELVGRGAAMASGGWSVLLRNDEGGKFAMSMGTTIVNANNVASNDTWYLVGFTRLSGTATLYVNGVAQSTTTANAPGSSADTWLGNCGGSTAGNHAGDKTMSWAFITHTPVSGSDWEQMYATGVIPGAIPAGWVWTADGAGGASWQPLP